MKPNFKLALTALAGILLTALASSYLLSDLVRRERLEERKFYSSHLRKSARQIIQIQSNEWADKLASNIEKNIASPVNSPSGAAIQQLNDQLDKSEVDFFAIATVKASATMGAGWEVDWFKASHPGLNKEWLQSEIKNAPIENVKGEQLVWMRLESADHLTYFALLEEVQFKVGENLESKIAIGILPTSIFSDINLITKGDKEDLYIVNSFGFTFSYPEVQYVGTKFDSNPVVNSILKNLSNEATQEYTQPSGDKIVGGYDRVNNTNLFVVMTLPAGSTGKTLLQYVIEMALVCLAIMTAILFLILYFGSKETEKIVTLQKNLELLAQKRNQNEVQEKGAMVLSSPNSYQDFSQAIALYLNESFTALLGYLQILESKVKDTAAKEGFDRIFAETRRIRDFIEALSNKMKGKSTQLESVALTPLINQVNSIFASKMAENNILFELNIKAEVHVKADFDLLKDALKTIMSFFIHKSNSQSANKKISLNVFKVGGYAEIQIEAQGLTVTDEEKKNIFQPFKVSVPESRIFDLDFALAHNHIQKLNGDMLFEKAGANKAHFVLRLPTLNEAVTSTDAPASEKLNPKLVLKSENVQTHKEDSQESAFQRLSIDSFQKIENAKTLVAPPPPPTAEAIDNEKGTDSILIRKPKLKVEP